MASQVSKPTLGILNQGTIFTCASAEDYSACRIFGLVITARCDIAQSKAPIYNYLPVISIDDWIHRDGRIILCDRVLRATQGKLKSELKQAGHSETILETESADSILQILFPDSGDKKLARSRERFEGLARIKTRIEKCLASNAEDGLIVQIGNEFPGERDALLKELTSQRLNGYYFMPSVDVNGAELGHVVLLREVRHIPRELAVQVGKGITKDEYDAECKERKEFANRLAFDLDDFAGPVGQLVSPNLEHLMQAFSFLFSRIGLPDIQADYVQKLWEMQPSVERSRQ